MDEIKLFDELQPPPPPDAARMREAVRARLTAAMSIPAAHPARRRNTMVAVAAGAALVAAGGTGYGLAAQGGPAPRPGTAPAGSASSLQGSPAGLTAVHGCPGKYITAGTLKGVSGTQLTLQPANDLDHANRDWRAKPVTVATTPSTAITRPVSATVSDITDGSHVIVQGTWSGGKLAATAVGIEPALPPLGSSGPKIPRPGVSGPGVPGHLRKIPMPRGWLGPPLANGTVTGAHGGSFTVLTKLPGLGSRRIQVTTSGSTKITAKARASLSQLPTGANVVAVGQIGPHGVLTASTVAERSGVEVVIAGGPAKIQPSGCSASAMTTAALQADS